MAEFNAFKGNKAVWTVAIVAGGGIFLYMYIKHKQAAQAAALAAASKHGYGANYGYASGYGYGVSPIYGYGFGGGQFGFPFSGYGGGYGYGGNPTPTTNAQWFQQAVAYLTQTGNYQSTAVLPALALYLSGQSVTSDQAMIISVAEAAIGPPPQAGPNGFPPNINTSGGPGGGGAVNPVTGLHISQPGTTGVDIAWDASQGAKSYKVTSSKGTPSMIGPTSARIHSMNPPGHPTSASVSVLAEPAASGAQAATITVNTH